jgi:hypothetical protein
MAAESRSERAHPPISPKGVLSHSRFESEQDGWAAEIAELPEYSRAPAEVVVCQSKPLAERVQDLTSSRMKNPGCNPISGYAGCRQHLLENSLRMFARKFRHSASQDIPQHAIFLLEAEKVTIGRMQQTAGGAPFNSAGVRARFGLKNSGSRAVAEKTGADQNAGIVVEVESGTANLHAYRQNALRSRRAD